MVMTDYIYIYMNLVDYTFDIDHFYGVISVHT